MSKNTDTQNRFKYMQLYDLLVGKITSGEYKPNERFPTEMELCKRFDLSRITVRDTLNMMEKEGYIYRKQGKGTFVAVRRIEQKLTKLYTLREGIEAKGMVPLNKILSFKIITPDERTREALKLKDGEKVYEIIRCCYASDVPYAVESSYIPLSVYPDMTAEMIEERGLYKTMQFFNVIPERAVENLTAVQVSPEEALLLNVNAADIAIRDERTTYSGDTVIEYTIDIIRCDFFSYTIEL